MKLFKINFRPKSKTAQSYFKHVESMDFLNVDDRKR